MLETVRRIIKNSSNIVIFSEAKLAYESGIVNYHEDDLSYDIELEYGYSPEEILTRNFMSRRADIFFDFYKKRVLQMDNLKPNDGHHSIFKLEQMDKLKTIITRNIYGLHQMAGSTKVIELYGNIHENHCPSCGQKYPLDYIINSKGEPRCEKCRVILRPDIALFGDNIDNGLMSWAADCIAQSDVLIVVGSSDEVFTNEKQIRHYEGEKLIIIKDTEGEMDSEANYVLYGKCSEILPAIIT